MGTAQTEGFRMPSAMGEVMASLLVVVDAWFEVMTEMSPGRYQSGDRVEVLGQLVRFISHRYRGFRQVPESDDVTPVLEPDTVGLRVRSPSPVPNGTQEIEAELARYGFEIKGVTGTGRREVLITCPCPSRATILFFPNNAPGHADR